MTTRMISAREKEVVLGTILGDSHIAMLKTGARLEMMHGEKQKKYIFWKYCELPSFVSAQPHRLEICDKWSHKVCIEWKFSTKVHSFFTTLREQFYPKDKKIVPSNISSLLISPLSLAVWFMDDGGRRNDCYGLFLNTLSFTKTEQEMLQECLRKNFSLDSRLHWVQDGYRIYIPSASARRFCEIVYPYIIPSMQYKLSYNPVTTSFARLDRARDRQKTRNAYNTLAPVRKCGRKV
jgi:hypothetical protein